MKQEPLKPVSFVAASKRIAYLAARVEATANAATPREKAARTSAVNALAREAKMLSQQNRRHLV